VNDVPKIEFPCDYPLKVIGFAGQNFKEDIVKILKKHCPEFDDAGVEVIPSRNQKYASLRFSILATGEDQINNLFLEIKAHKLVQMVL